MLLHNEARTLLVQAYEKNHNVQQTAQDFSVSKSTVYRLIKQKQATGSVLLKFNHCGRKPVLSQEELKQIKERINAQNDITIDELRDVLNLKASYSTVESCPKDGLYLQKEISSCK